MKLQVNLDVITSYRRLSYTPWYALAEFVDNSTESFYNNRSKLEKLARSGERPLEIKLEYLPNKGVIRVLDNAMGMSYKDLENALVLARRPENTHGRSRYGLGLKTAACWLGDLWTIRTKKLGESEEHTVTVDVPKIASGTNDLVYSKVENLDPSKHYTVVEITRLHRSFKGRTLGKIEQFLSSMFREDFRNKILTLLWRGKPLGWEDIGNQLLTDAAGNTYFKEVSFSLGKGKAKKRITGWAGILKEGSRSRAGFTILHSRRVIKGFPEAWRPTSLFGQLQGSNDLVNQRLIGEFHLDDFDVTHTKDDILWLGDEEDQVEDKLQEELGYLRQVARSYRKHSDDQRRPSDIDTKAALDTLSKEIESPEMNDALQQDPMLTPDIARSMFEAVINRVTEQFHDHHSAKIGNLTIKWFVESKMSALEPYITIDSAKVSEVIIIINAAHPHWIGLGPYESILNYLRHCVYDGIAEWQARHKVGHGVKIDPDTVKLLKDKLLRLPFDIEQHEEPTS